VKKDDTEQKGSHSTENKSNIKDNIKAVSGKKNAVQKHYIKKSNGKTDNSKMDNRKMDNSKMDDNQKANTNVKKTRRRSSPSKTIPKLDLNGNKKSC
jgi:hypothetical protein